MSFSEKYTKWFRYLLPAPFTIAIILTMFTFVLSLSFGDELPSDNIAIEKNDFTTLCITENSNAIWTYQINGQEKKVLNDSLYLENITEVEQLKVVISESGNSYQTSIEFSISDSGELVPENNSVNQTLQLLNHWYDGLWGKGYLAFAFQMMLMLLLGHVLALSKPVDKFLNRITPICKSTAEAAMYITFFTVLVSLFNWGLGLIFGAVFARKVGEFALRSNISLNYPIIGAAGYSGLMVWHGGISGSSLAKISEEGHFESLVSNKEILAQLPDVIPFTETVFSSMNLFVSLCLIVLLPLGMYWIGKKAKPTDIRLKEAKKVNLLDKRNLIGAENLDHSYWLAYVVGGGILLFAIYKAYVHPGFSEMKFINPDYINFMLLGLVLLFHGSLFKVLKGVDQAIGGVSGILLQFPLYFGIMGIMNNSGLIEEISEFFRAHSTSTTYPIFTFFSAGLVNVFVPSGGGQWMVQGPIVLQTAVEMGLSVPKSIMALAYGDQITNMLQPFWALPLLGITGLKAKEILPYTLYLMLVGTVIFIVGLLLF